MTITDLFDCMKTVLETAFPLVTVTDTRPSAPEAVPFLCLELIHVQHEQSGNRRFLRSYEARIQLGAATVREQYEWAEQLFALLQSLPCGDGTVKGQRFVLEEEEGVRYVRVWYDMTLLAAAAPDMLMQQLEQQRGVRA